jgi:RNA recognition motif-containing protein
MSSRQQSRVVFVGNIPYGLTEEQITEIFSAAGRVINFRLVYDRDSGRPKGFGFAEFPDYGTNTQSTLLHDPSRLLLTIDCHQILRPLRYEI